MKTETAKKSISGKIRDTALKAFTAFLDTLDPEEAKALTDNWPMALRGLEKAATPSGTIFLEILKEDRKPLESGYQCAPEWREGAVGRGRFTFASVLSEGEERITDQDFFVRAEEIGADGTLMDAYALLRIQDKIPAELRHIRFVFTDARIIDTTFGTQQVAEVIYWEGEWQLYWNIIMRGGKNFTDNHRPVRFK